MKLPQIIPIQQEDKLKSIGVSIIAFLDKVRKRKDNTFSVRIRVTFNRLPKYYSTKINLTEEQYLQLFDPELKGTLKTKKKIIINILQKACDDALNLKQFSFKLFEKSFLNKAGDGESIIHWFDKKIKELENAGRLNTSSSYKYARDSLKNFVDKENLKFKDIDMDFLSGYENYMLSNGKSITTIGIYLRNIRHLFNQAIDNKDIKPDLYPFGKNRYRIPTSENKKKALRLIDIQKIANYNAPKGTPERYYKDMWMFSYLGNGINVKDISLLKYGNIEGTFIRFVRAKTVRNRRTRKQIEIYLLPELNDIIKRWGTKPIKPENYIFPVLNEGLTAFEEQVKIKQFTKQINKYIKRIKEELEINSHITTYSARHSYATVLKNAGIPVSFISEALGHSNISVTQNYLDSIEDDQKREISKKLLAFATEEKVEKGE